MYRQMRTGPGGPGRKPELIPPRWQSSYLDPGGNGPYLLLKGL